MIQKASRSRRTSGKLVAAGVIFAATAGVHAAVVTWDPSLNGTGSDAAGTWDTTTAEWATGTGDVVWPNTSGDTAQFGAGGTGTDTVTLGTAITAGSVVFKAGPVYTLGGTTANNLTLGSGGITVAAAAGSETIATPIALSANQTWTNSGTGTLTDSSVISGAFGITFAGNTTLGITNTFTGAAVVNSGTLTVSAANGTGGALARASSITVNNGASIVATNDNALVAGGSTVPITLNAGGILTNTSASNASGHLGPLTFNGGTLATGVGTSYTNNNYYGSWNIDKGVTVTANSTISATNVTPNQVGGTIFNVGSGDALAVTGTLTYTAGTPDTGVIINGAGTTTFSNGGNTFRKGLTINGGTVIATAQASNNSATGPANSALGPLNGNNGGIAVNAGGTLSFQTNNVFGNGSNSGGTINTNIPTITLTGGTLSATQYNVVGNLVLNSGATVTQSVAAGGYPGFQFLGSITAGGTSASTIAATGTGADNLGASTDFIVPDVTSSSANDLVVTAPLQNQSSDFAGAAGSLVKDGAGTLALNAVNTATGTATINSGVLNLVHSYSSTGYSTVAFSSMTVNSGATLLTTGTHVFGYNQATRPTLIINGGAVTNAGNDNYLGTITMTGGSLGGTGNYRLQPNTGTAYTFTTNAAASTATVSIPTLTLYGNSTFNVAADTAGLASDLAVSSVVNGNVATYGVIKTGAGVMSLTGTNTYAGGTTVSAGTLIAGADSALGTGNVSVASGATLNDTGGTLNNYVADAATLALVTGSTDFLNYTGTDFVAALTLDGVSQPSGVYSALNDPTFFTGTGSITVAAVPEPATISLLGLASLAAVRRRRSTVR